MLRLAWAEVAPSAAVIVAVVFGATAFVVTLNLALTELGGTEQVAGTDAAEEFDESLTRMLPALELGVALRVTTPDELVPPVTVVGESPIEIT